MVTTLARNRWARAWPGLTLTALELLVGTFALLDGALLLALAYRLRARARRYEPLDVRRALACPILAITRRERAACSASAASTRQPSPWRESRTNAGHVLRHATGPTLAEPNRKPYACSQDLSGFEESRQALAP
jgi:hypothetical protein